MEKTQDGLYLYWSVKQRLAHIALFVGVIGAVVTGIPLKYYDLAFGKAMFDFFGSYFGVMLMHQAFGMVVISVLLIHFFSIIYVWLRSENFTKLIQMTLNVSDLKNVINLIKYFLFLGKKPEYGRYTLFEKADYFVSLICICLLAVSGLILEFPIATTSFVSISWLPISHHLHSSLAAFYIIYIIMGHLFNTHIHPEKLYLNNVWIFGTLTEDQMKSRHYYEYKTLLERDVAIREEYKRKAYEVTKKDEIKQEKMKLEDYLSDGNRLAQSGKYEEAINRYKEAIKIYPNYSQARFNLGVVYKKAKKYEEAINIFKEFLELDPFNTMADGARKSLRELDQLKNEPVIEASEIDDGGLIVGEKSSIKDEGLIDDVDDTVIDDE